MHIVVAHTLAPKYIALIPFFTSNVSDINVKLFSRKFIHADVQVIPGPNEYPPVNFTFDVLEKIINYDFDWYVRCDADSMVDYEQLKQYLMNIHDTRPLWMGHRVFGRPFERHNLNITFYSEGGICDIFNFNAAVVLRKTLKHCRSNIFLAPSYLHSDVEIGRCFHASGLTFIEHAKNKFYSVYPVRNMQYRSVPLRKLVSIKDLYSPIVLHPVKSSHSYRYLRGDTSG